MEASTITPETTPETPDPTAERSPATGQTASKLFQWSTYLHVGEGAEECAGTPENPGPGLTGRCENADHFHAFLRLPNQFQYDSIRDKAMAAKARKSRQMRMEGSDAYEILHSELDAIRRSPGAKEALIEDLVGREFLMNQSEARKDAIEEEEFATIDEDFERLRVLQAMDPEERPHDEYVELQDHIQKFTTLVESLRTKREEPLRTALAEKDLDELIKQIEDVRIEAEASEIFMREYSKWEWIVGTLKCRLPKRSVEQWFPDPNVLDQAPPEVMFALDQTFAKLEDAMRAEGNS